MLEPSFIIADWLDSIRVCLFQINLKYDWKFELHAFWLEPKFYLEHGPIRVQSRLELQGRVAPRWSGARVAIMHKGMQTARFIWHFKHFHKIWQDFYACYLLETCQLIKIKQERQVMRAR